MPHTSVGLLAEGYSGPEILGFKKFTLTIAWPQNSDDCRDWPMINVAVSFFPVQPTQSISLWRMLWPRGGEYR
jgi:hypothetical protein